jgi:hypothetical protein
MSPSQGINSLTPQSQISRPSNSSDSETGVYYVQRRFLQNSKLHAYLSHKCPEIISIRKYQYNLYEVRKIDYIQ